MLPLFQGNLTRRLPYIMGFTVRVLIAFALLFALAHSVRADRLRLIDGSAIEVDEAWEDAQGVWYRRNGVTHLVDRARIRRIERTSASNNPRTNGVEASKEKVLM